MTNIKKQFTNLHSLLIANQGKKLTKNLVAEFEELMTSKVASSTVRKDDEGNVTHVFCYYHKEWEDVNEVPYGKKSNTASGLNTMCKQGLSHWTKQNRKAKQEESELLSKVASGEVDASEVGTLLEEIKERAKTIVAFQDQAS
jgi:hypothetical protein